MGTPPRHLIDNGREIALTPDDLPLQLRDSKMRGSRTALFTVAELEGPRDRKTLFTIRDAETKPCMVCSAKYIHRVDLVLQDNVYLYGHYNVPPAEWLYFNCPTA